MSVDLSIVIPAYNESQRIGPTLKDLNTFLQTLEIDYEILVVDDGSKDHTVALVNRIAQTMPNLRVIGSEENRGKGSAVRLGMMSAKGHIIVMTDADGSVSPEQIPNLVEPLLRREKDIVIGSRNVTGSRTDLAPPFYRRIWSRGFY